MTFSKFSELTDVDTDQAKYFFPTIFYAGIPGKKVKANKLTHEFGAERGRLEMVDSAPIEIRKIT